MRGPHTRPQASQSRVHWQVRWRLRRMQRYSFTACVAGIALCMVAMYDGSGGLQSMCLAGDQQRYCEYFTLNNRAHTSTKASQETHTVACLSGCLLDVGPRSSVVAIALHELAIQVSPEADSSTWTRQDVSPGAALMQGQAGCAQPDIPRDDHVVAVLHLHPT